MLSVRPRWRTEGPVEPQGGSTGHPVAIAGSGLFTVPNRQALCPPVGADTGPVVRWPGTQPPKRWAFWLSAPLYCSPDEATSLPTSARRAFMSVMADVHLPLATVYASEAPPVQLALRGWREESMLFRTVSRPVAALAMSPEAVESPLNETLISTMSGIVPFASVYRWRDQPSRPIRPLMSEDVPSSAEEYVD